MQYEGLLEILGEEYWEFVMESVLKNQKLLRLFGKYKEELPLYMDEIEKINVYLELYNGITEIAIEFGELMEVANRAQQLAKELENVD